MGNKTSGARPALLRDEANAGKTFSINSRSELLSDHPNSADHTVAALGN